MASKLERYLDRDRLYFDTPSIKAKSILVTGSDGFLGRKVTAALKLLGARVTACDLPFGDIMSDMWVNEMKAQDFSACIHLAAHKYAAYGEERPAEVADVNVRGTQNVVDAINGAKLVLASTCKAADPCTAYGASKLIAERVALNAGGSVMRLVNVLDSTGSVMEIWRETPADMEIAVTNCKRMWITPDEAVEFLISGLCHDIGTYIPDVPDAEPVKALADRVHPRRPKRAIGLRNGDRPIERLISDNETCVVPQPEYAIKSAFKVIESWQDHRSALRAVA